MCAILTGGDLMESEFDGRYSVYPVRNERFPTTLAWIIGTSVIVGFLTAMLVVGIAITV